MIASDVYKFLPSQSIKALIRISSFINELVELKTPNEKDFVVNADPDDYITYTPSFLSSSDSDLMMLELQSSLGLEGHGTKTKSAWFTNCQTPYSWNSVRTGKVTKKKPVALEGNSAILGVMNRINEHLGTSLNACLVQYYPVGQSGVRLHDDLEPEMNCDDPIAVVSVGAERRVEFLHNYQLASDFAIKTIVPAHGSLYIMGSGTQDFFRHRVPSDRSCNSWRASFSFRRVVGPTMHDLLSTASGKIVNSNAGTLVIFDETVEGDISTLSESIEVQDQVSSPGLSGTKTSTDSDFDLFSSGTISPSASGMGPSTASGLAEAVAPPSPSLPNKTVLFGSSMTRYINEKRLSNSNCKFVNFSRSGARLLPRNGSPVYREMVEEFVSSNNSDLHLVDRVVFSVGTNDLRFFRDRYGNPGDLRAFIQPIEELISLSRQCFGHDVKIYFHSVLPMRCLYTYTAANFEGFNRLLRDICTFNGCFYVDWFNMFLNCQGSDIDLSLYWDTLHLSRQGCNILHNLLDDLLINHFSNYCNVYTPKYL